MSYTVTATVPAPVYDPSRPVFGHHESTQPSGKPYPNGDKGRKITVTSETEAVAMDLAAILARAGLQDVTVV